MTTTFDKSATNSYGSYKVKEIFYTLQGEGRSSGRPAVFCRFSGCNLWSGREKDRSNGKGSCAAWCDTDFVGGKRYTEEELVQKIKEAWGRDAKLKDCASGIPGVVPMVVFTGGEPALQLTESLLHRMRVENWNVEVETNGTTLLPKGVYWTTVSPKHGTEFRDHGHALKVVWPQDFNLEELEKLSFKEFYLQPMDGPNLQDNIEATVRTCLSRPKWRLSLQTHKIVGIR